MNGPDHYREAERLVEAAKTDVRAADTHLVLQQAIDRACVAIQAAAVHAQLAQVAASIEEQVALYTGSDSSVLASWGEAIS